MADINTTENSLHPPYAEWRDAALADGWEETEGGVWSRPNTQGSRYPGDNTVLLTKNDAIIWLVDRVTLNHRELWTAGWLDHGQRAIDVPDTYDPAAIEEQRGVCYYCHKGGDPKRLAAIGFAGRVCPECDTEALRNKVEFPGWTN